MAIVLALLIGFLASRAAVLSGRDLLAAPALQRTNYRGHRLPTAGGILVVISVFVVEGLRAVASAVGFGDYRPDPMRVALVLALTGFALIGLVDDLAVDTRARGFSGHLRAAASGKVTGGTAKLLAGGALAAMLVASVRPADGWRILVDAALVALAANLTNLLDLAPGRTIKTGVVAWTPLAIAGFIGSNGSAAVRTGVTAAVIIGAFVGILFDDLREHLMLGDAGANALGAVLGLQCVLIASPTVRLVVAAVLFVLNLASEFVSFSRVIERVGLLRRFDDLGVLPARRSR